MRKQGYIQNVIIAVLAVSILIMSVGYAFYNASLDVEGTATFNKASWQVRFKDGTFNELSDIKSTENNLGETSVSYKVTLPAPGSEYSFDVTVENTGTMDAKLTKITLAGVSAEDKYIEYSAEYAGTTYYATTEGLSIPLNAGATEDLNVTVKYIAPENADDLPSTDKTLTLSAILDYQSIA